MKNHFFFSLLRKSRILVSFFSLDWKTILRDVCWLKLAHILTQFFQGGKPAQNFLQDSNRNIEVHHETKKTWNNFYLMTQSAHS